MSDESGPPTLDERESSRLEALLRDLRPAEVEADLARRLETAVIEARGSGRRVVPGPGLVWIPLSAAAAIALAWIGFAPKPGQPGPEPVESLVAQRETAQAPELQPAVSETDTEAIAAEAFDRAVARQVAADRILRSQLGRQVGLSNQGLIHDESGQLHQIINFRLDESLNTSSDVSENRQQSRVNRERTLLVPLEYY